MIELRTNWGHANITEDMIKKYRRFVALLRTENTLIPNAMREADAECIFVSPEGTSLIGQLITRQVDLAIAIQYSTRHAYPIKRDRSKENSFLAINQSGTQLANPVYTPLIDAPEVHFYHIKPKDRDLAEEDEVEVARLLQEYEIV
ncbi:BTB/POZ domain-containing protein [Endozoicomonas euniceicola]|uniref:Reverse transcriptase/retrotransposon-derived protein RNase H-like domain-containing protein n=1 Tax=Endozoicomonas euniceicola TaxID=1234143 RepID=A0ABY6GRH4_9GAMM|nr:hypothetical protein [Endozoicomonas euniceicola]UYM15342.1 hypothetical protein NX720_21190 [Endozoicomonas euniceicola]